MIILHSMLLSIFLLYVLYHSKIDQILFKNKFFLMIKWLICRLYSCNMYSNLKNENFYNGIIKM